MKKRRERIEDVLQSLEPGRDRELVSRAASFARRVHEGQKRADGSSVWEHVLSVAEWVIEAGHGNATVVAAALLHDVLEQTPLILNDLERDFGTRVSSIVDAVTLRPGDETRDSVARAEAAGEDAVLVRVCDRIDAARRVEGRPEETRQTYLDAIRNHHLPMARRYFPEFSAELDKAIRDAEKISSHADE